MKWVVIIVIFLIITYLLAEFFVKRSIEKNALRDDELLRFFAPNEKLTALQVLDRIVERTEGRRNPPHYWVIQKLNELDNVGKLKKELIEREHTVKKGVTTIIRATLYSLP